MSLWSSPTPPPAKKPRLPAPTSMGTGGLHRTTTPPASALNLFEAGPTAALPVDAGGLPAGQCLAGNPLAPPHHAVVGWRAGDCFSAADDPDRMDLVWEPPAFLAQTTPALRRPRTAATAVGLPRGCADRIPLMKPFAKMVHNVLVPAECAALLAAVNAKGYTPALTNFGDGIQGLDPGYRSSGRCIVDSPELASHLFELVKAHVPPTLFGGGTRSALQVREVNERCRFLCYRPGQAFAPHCDGCYTRPPGHPAQGDTSRVTLQLYLHDLPEDHGGATTFIGRDGDRVPCQPRCGSILLFTQNLYHEGSLLRKGLKYTMRTEVMYRHSAEAAKAGATKVSTKAVSQAEAHARRQELQAMLDEDARGH